MDSLLLGQFQTLVAARVGLNLREQERELLIRVLAARLQASHLSGEAYLSVLQGDGAQSEAEWKELSIRLTNQESYFFRDEGQFSLLRQHVLPEIIERNRRARTLRLWSAGCSTGQEPYSLAILVDQLLPGRNWNIHILGTDLSEAALEKARAAVYSSWSFRAMSSEVRDRFFARRQKDYELEPRIRQMVSFQHGNLLRDHFPSQTSGIHDIDLILCRNVFIYFKREAVATVLRKFNKTLAPNGYLLTGHTELHNTPLGDLQARTFPQTVIYQHAAPTESARANEAGPRPGGIAFSTAIAPVAPVAPAPKPAMSRMSTHGAASNSNGAPVSVAPAATSALALAATKTTADSVRADSKANLKTDAQVDVIARGIQALRQGRSGACLALLEELPDRDGNFAAQCVAAQACANAGRLEEAEQHCLRAAQLDPVAALPPHVLARVAGERGDNEQAKRLLKQVIYLAPALALPYVELGDLYAREGDATRAATMRQTALELLADLRPDEPVPSHPLSGDAAIPAGEAQRHLREHIAS